MSSSAAPAITGKVFARTASVRIDNACNSFLNDCFRQFGIHIVPLPGDPVVLFKRQKFEACVLRLYDPDAEKVLQAARNSPSNKKIVIYGIARTTQEALRYSNYGINAVLDEPLDRQSVLKVVRATHLLVIHELRRYVRVPVVTEAVIENGGRRFEALTVEMSSGGMSVRCPNSMPPSDPINVSFALPGNVPVTVRAHVCWSKPAEKLCGLRLDPTDERRFRIRSWIDQYLEIV